MKKIKEINPQVEKQIKADINQWKDDKRAVNLYLSLLKKLKNSNHVSKYTNWKDFFAKIKAEYTELGKLRIPFKERIEQQIYNDVSSIKPEWLDDSIYGKLIKSLEKDNNKKIYSSIGLNVVDFKLDRNESFKIYKEKFTILDCLMVTDLFTYEKRIELINSMYNSKENHDLLDLIEYNFFINAYIPRKMIEILIDSQAELRQQRIELYESMQDIISKLNLTKKDKIKVESESKKWKKKYFPKNKNQEELVKHYFRILLKSGEIPNYKKLESEIYTASSWFYKLKNVEFLTILIKMIEKKLENKRLLQRTKDLLIKNKIYFNRVVEEIQRLDSKTTGLVNKNKRDYNDQILKTNDEELENQDPLNKEIAGMFFEEMNKK